MIVLSCLSINATPLSVSWQITMLSSCNALWLRYIGDMVTWWRGDMVTLPWHVRAIITTSLPESWTKGSWQITMLSTRQLGWKFRQHSKCQQNLPKTSGLHYVIVGNKMYIKIKYTILSIYLFIWLVFHQCTVLIWNLVYAHYAIVRIQPSRSPP